MFRSLRSRLLLTYLLTTGLVLMIVGISLMIFIISNPFGQRLVFQQLNEVASRVEETQLRFLSTAQPAQLENAMRRIDPGNQARILILGPNGQLLVDSRPGRVPLITEEIVFRLDSAGSLEGEIRDDSRLRWLYVARLLESGRWLMLASPRVGVRSLPLFFDDLVRPLLQAAVVGLLVSSLLAWLISRWVAGPLQRMAGTARAVADGQVQDHFSVSGPQEVRTLAEAFNEMISQVQTSRQSMRDFVTNVSHELKTPLTSIQGFAQAIMDGTASDAAAQKQASRVIYDESDRLRRLVEELLDLARIETGQVDFERQPVELNAVLKAVAERLSLRAVEAMVDLVLEAPPLTTIIGDGDRLAQVFTNLIENAINHAPSEGKVRVTGEAQAGWVLIHVDDNGEGIPEADLVRIFERFYQVDKARRGGKGRGVGLGLAISNEIVQVHGGHLTAQSILGRGSRFTVRLPIVHPQDETLVARRS